MDTKKKSSEILVKFSDVTKQYGDLVVLDKLNLEIKKNEMVSIIGPSGSGKTTVLRVLMTLEKINQVSLLDLHKFAQRIFAKPKAALVLYGPVKNAPMLNELKDRLIS